MQHFENLKSPLVNFNFILRVELSYDMPLKSIKAFTRELEYEYIQEGGLNDYVHMRRAPITKPFTLEIERYALKESFDPLILGVELELPILLMIYENPPEVLGSEEDADIVYAFSGCTVIKKSYGELDATKSGLLVQNITIAYKEMVRLENS